MIESPPLPQSRQAKGPADTLFSQLPAIVWTLDASLHCTSCAGTGLEAFNVTAEAFVGKTLAQALDLRDDPVREAVCRAALSGVAGSFSLETSGRSFHVNVAPERTHAHEVVGAIAVAIDVSELTYAAAALGRTEAALAQTQRIAHVGSWDNHLITGRFIWSDEFYRLLGLQPGEVEASEAVWRRFIHPADDTYAFERMEHAKATRTPYKFDRRITRTDGSIRWLQQQAEYVYDDAGVPVRIVGTSLDITERKEAEERLAYLAHHDPLTELPNRALLASRLSELIAAAHRRAGVLAVLFIDLDRFKTINDTLGHRVGDRFLRAVAARLEGAVRPGDLVARISGDEFVIVSPVGNDEDADRLATRVLAALEMRLEIEGNDLYPSASIGVCVSPRDGDTADELIANADTAMYRAKSLGRNTFRRFMPEMLSAAQERLALEADLRGALERDELFVLYQPIFDRCKRPVAVEALLQWRHPTRGTVSPERFIPIAEETGLMGAIGAYVMRVACEQMQRWRASTQTNLRVAINVSGRQLQRRSFVQMVAATLRDTELDPQALQLEITESVIINDVKTNTDILCRLKKLGVGVSIDDFGTGYSSLAYLKTFPLDIVKIDRSFVRNLPHEPDDAAIVAGIVNLAHSLHLQVVAEGVETADQVAALLRIGCDQLQGFYFARPLSTERFAERFALR